MVTKVIIVGAEPLGEKVFNKMKDNEELTAVADIAPQRIGQLFCGTKVIPVEEIRNYDYDIIKVSSQSWYYIYPYLQKLGVEAGKLEIDLSEETFVPLSVRLYAAISLILILMIIYVFLFMQG